MRRMSMIAAGFAALLLGQTLTHQPLAQQPVPRPAPQDAEKMPPMTLRARIALPGVYGRMDHYGWDSKRGILLVSALGNNTVEVIDLKAGKRLKTISGLREPQTQSASRCRRSASGASAFRPKSAPGAVIELIPPGATGSPS